MGEVNDSNLYVSLDEAREELKKRWNDVELRKKVEKELGENFWSEFKLKPRSLLWRPLLSPDNGFTFFYQCSKFIDSEPLAFEFLGDMYMSFNEEKRGLGCLHLELENNKKMIVNIIDLHKWNKKTFLEIKTKTGELLVDFHHNLIKYSGYKIEVRDMTNWVRNNSKPKFWYYKYLLHFLAHGVLFDAYLALENEKDRGFFRDVVYTNIKKIEKNFGIKPLIIKHYPDNQNDGEDFYWWSYPPNINDYLINYAKKYNLNFRNAL